MKIPPVKIIFDEREREKIKEQIDGVLISGFLSLGKYGSEFESEYSNYLGVKYGIATNSGTSALEIIFRSLSLRDAEIIIPTNTFFATPAAVLHSGNKVRFADCDLSLCVTKESIEKQITSETRAVVVVHIGGIVAPDIVAIKEMCKEKGLFLIEDAAHAQGSSLGGVKAGRFGDAAAFSFFATKVMTCGEGGIIVTNNEGIYDKARAFRDQGKVGKGNIHVELGYNWRMSEVSAILGLSQLKKLNEFIKSRRCIAKIYEEKLQSFENITPLKINVDNKSNYYKYVCFTKDLIRYDLKRILKEKYGVCLSGEVYELPCHLQPVFGNLGYRQGDFPVAENLCNNHICLPIYPNMPFEEVDYVMTSLGKVLG
jgi:perosamine synthetase